MTATKNVKRVTMLEMNGKTFWFENILVWTKKWMCWNDPSHGGYATEARAWAAMVRSAKQHEAGWVDGTTFGVYENSNGRFGWYYRLDR